MKTTAQKYSEVNFTPLVLVRKFTRKVYIIFQPDEKVMQKLIISGKYDMLQAVIDSMEVGMMGIMDIFKKKPDAKPGDVLCFGEYNFENETDLRPMEWIVLDSGKKDLLLISRYCIDTVSYCGPSFKEGKDTIWEYSYLRNWLNDTFYTKAFSGKEKRRIIETTIATDDSANPALHKNKVFVLSQAQVVEFFPDESRRRGFPTPYAVQRGAGIDQRGKTVWWWTRPIRDQWSSPRFDFPAIVNQDGELLYHSRLVASPGSQHTAVRPAIRIKK